MSQRTLLMIAAGLTAFMLVVVGGLASRISLTAAAPPAVDTATPALDPGVEALIKDREAAYQAALAEANAQIARANEQIARANEQIAQAPPAIAAAASGPASAEQAAQIALNYRGGGEVREVEPEQERGGLVYDVQFTDGASVYIDAATGQVVYARLGGEHEGGEHEGGEHDDDEHDD